MKILRCPNCNTVTVVPDHLTDADLVRCASCKTIDFVTAYSGRQRARMHATPDLTADFINGLAAVVNDIESYDRSSTIDAFVKETCKGYNVSPWAVVSALNALLARRYGQPPVYNPLKLVRLEQQHVNIDDLYDALSRQIDHDKDSVRSESADHQQIAVSSSKEAEIWHHKFLDQKKQYDELDRSYSELLDEYRRACDILDKYGLR